MPPVSTLIATALPIEFDAVSALLQDVQQDRHHAGDRYLVGRYSGTSLDYKVTLIETGKGSEDAAVSVERAIEHCSPQIAIFCGVAGGVKDTKIGDVVVATDIFGYEYGKAAGDRFYPRPVIANCSRTMVQVSQSVFRERRASLNYAILHAPIAAGAKVVASRRSATAQFLRDNYSHVVAVEMEGIAFGRALAASPHVLGLIVRGISDLLSNKTASDRAGTQERAAMRASEHVFHILDELRPPDLLVPANPPVTPDATIVDLSIDARMDLSNPTEDDTYTMSFGMSFQTALSRIYLATCRLARDGTSLQAMNDAIIDAVAFGRKVDLSGSTKAMQASIQFDRMDGRQTERPRRLTAAEIRERLNIPSGRKPGDFSVIELETSAPPGGAYYRLQYKYQLHVKQHMFYWCSDRATSLGSIRFDVSEYSSPDAVDGFVPTIVPFLPGLPAATIVEVSPGRFLLAVNSTVAQGHGFVVSW